MFCRRRSAGCGRSSVDFDFFCDDAFDPDDLARRVSYLDGAERVQVAASMLTCRIERGGPVLVSFLGDLRLGRVAPRDPVAGLLLHVASLLDLAGTKAAIVQKRAEAKDYIDIDALIRHGIGLSTVLAAGVAVHGPAFNPLITLKALSYFDDIPALPADLRARLAAAVRAVDPARLPILVADHPRDDRPRS
jgi:hypothetical protein